MFSGKLAEIHLATARNNILEFPDGYKEYVHKGNNKDKTLFVESPTQLERRANLTQRINSGELVRAKAYTGGNWGVDSRTSGKCVSIVVE